MSVWASRWAWAQKLGAYRERNGERAYKGDPGAKLVLVALADYADEEGYCYPSQDTLADMTDMSARSVREHMYNLEHVYKLIRREHRKHKGRHTSDGIWLLAPPDELKPPHQRQSSPAAESTVGEKRANQRQSSPSARRQNSPPNHQGNHQRNHQGKETREGYYRAGGFGPWFE